MTPPRIEVAQARRLALHAQGLAQPIGRRRARPADVAALVSRLGCLQLDPVSPVARSPLLVAHSRLGLVEDADLDAAAYGPGRRVFDAWAHEASLVHVDDLALHRHAQRTYLDGASPGHARAREFLQANADFAAEVVQRLRADGPLRASALEDTSVTPWRHGWWTDEVSSRQTIHRMLALLWRTGRIGVAGRRGQERLWDVFERCVPEGALDALDGLSQDEFDRRAALRALRLLGVARAAHVRDHFLRRRVRDVAGALAGVPEVVEVRVEGTPGTWLAHEEDLDRAGSLEPGRRTVALSPFDNVLCDRRRTTELFDFDHKLEIYVPPDKRRWGYYVLPVLHGERFVARADLLLDRDARVLRVLALHHEPGRRAPRAVATALERLAAWRGASGVVPSAA